MAGAVVRSELDLFRALHEIAVAVGGVLDPLELARIVAERASALLDADAAGVYLWDQAHETLEPIYSSEPAESAAGLKLAVPIRVADRTTGTLSVQFDTPHLSSPQQIEMLTLVAAQVAPALDAARMYADARHQMRERELVEEALRASHQLTQEVIAYAGEGIIVFDAALRYIVWNPFMEELTRIPAADVLGQQVGERFPHMRDEGTVAMLERALAGETVQSGDMMYSMRASGRRGWCSGTYTPRRDADGKVFGVIGVVHEITQRKNAEANLRHQTLHDSLTGLPNRMLLRDRLKQALRGARRDQLPFALLLLDLDRFKDVNDALGHQAGDALLRLMGRRLAAAMREVDTLARLGGDEFAILLPGADEAGVLRVAGRLMQMLEKPFELNGSSLDVGGSFGIALYPQHGDDAEVLLQRADVAMYVAKRAGGGYAVYEPKQDHHTPERLAFHTELRLGIERGELVLYYQPKFSCHDGQLVGVEALVRWRHPRRGLVMPDEFIPLAEQTGLITSLSRWVLEAVVRQCRLWQDAGRHIPIAVNLSMRDLHDSDLPETISNLLTLWKVAPELLRAEITESSLMADPERALATVARLSEQGVRIAIDDFGTGYSSLAYLKKLPVDELKIDRSFVSEMRSDASDRAIVRSTIDLAHNLGLRVVAEGVEDAETWQLLAQLGCDEAQGYHLGRPAPSTALDTWLFQPLAEAPPLSQAA